MGFIWLFYTAKATWRHTIAVSFGFILRISIQMRRYAMKIKCSVFIAISLDGFIARPNGAIDWLDDPSNAGAAEDYGYKAFMDSVDVLIMGRKTYEQVLSFKEWPYGDKRMIVLSSGSLKIPKNLSENVEVMRGSPAQVLEQLSQSSIRHCYVDGGKTIQGFLKAGLIHEMTITQIPILIGDGLPLFGRLDWDIRFEHLETKAYPSGFVQSKYRTL
jgi:dihydrofolate reductase